MSTHRFIILISCLFFLGLFCSCSVNSKPPQSIEYYTLDYEEPEFEAQPTLPITLFIEKFNAASPYNTTRIVYSKNRFSQNKYYYHQWITTPEELIHPLIVRDFIASKRFHAVMKEGGVDTSYQLVGTLDEFYEKDTDTDWNAVLSITITLINRNADDEIKRTVFQKNYKIVQPLEQKNPQGLARGLSLALAEISDMMISDIYQLLQ